MRNHSLLSVPAKLAVALVPPGNVELRRSAHERIGFLRLPVRERRSGRHFDLAACGWRGFGAIGDEWSRVENIQQTRTRLHMKHHRVRQARLGVSGGLVAIDPSQPHSVEYRADVLMLELDRSVGPLIKKWLKRLTVLGLLVRKARNLLGQHLEVIRDNPRVLFRRPVNSCHFS